MPPEEAPASRVDAGVVVSALVAVGLAAASYLFLGRLHLNLADEGYLWYGTLRVLEGQVPMRDFQSYDPGRYYWSALGALVWGPGILALRLSGAAFQALGLFAGLLVARRVVRHVWLLLPVGLVLAGWMFPRHKFIEASLAMAAVYVAVRLFEKPSSRMHLIAGVFVGAAGFMGKNHGLYAFLGLLLLIGFLHVKLREGSLLRKLGAWAAGIAIGSAPMILMLGLAPGFFDAFVDSTRTTLAQGTNLPAPYPWPWRMEYAGLDWGEWLSQISLAISFMLPVLVYPIGLILAATARPGSLRSRSVLICSSMIGIFYAHHAAVRSDVLHLAQCIHPLLLGVFALPMALGRSKRRAWQWVAWVLFAWITWFSVMGANPLLRDGRFRRALLVEHYVAGDALLLEPRVADYLSRVEAVVRRHVANETLFIAPFFPAFYPLLGKSAPCKETYFFWPRAEREVQLRMIQDFESHGLRWALIVVTTIDRREDLFFSQSHPLVRDYLGTNFVRVRTPELPGNHLLLRRREPTGTDP